MNFRVIGSPWAIVAIVTLVVAALDQLTKRIAIETIGPGGNGEPVGIIPSVLQFRYVENSGAAFGILQDSTSFLIVVSIGVIALLALVFGSMITRSRLLGLAFGLQFGGALGNLIDRLRLGYVVDFIDVPRFPNFNVADSGITVGVAILAFVLLIRPAWVADEEHSTEDTSVDSQRAATPTRAEGEQVAPSTRDLDR